MSWSVPSADLPLEVARCAGVAGELALRRRGDVLELIIDGVFTMDSGRPDTERALAERALAERALAERALGELPGGSWHVAVAGLGLGYTAAAVLADPRVSVLDVVEVEPALVAWAEQGLLPVAAVALADPRTRLHVGDALDVLPSWPGAALDAVLLDLDNGPGFLVHPSNAPMYRDPWLARLATTVRPGGVVAVWSATAGDALERALGVIGPCRVELMPVRRDGRSFDYAIYLARRASPGTAR